MRPNYSRKHKYPGQPQPRNELHESLSDMQKHLHSHKQTQPAAREPHVRRRVSRETANGAATRAPAKGASARAAQETARASHARAVVTGDTLKIDSLATLVVQREAGDTWRWTAYTTRGDRLAYQDACTDAAEACLQALAYLNDFTLPDEATGPPAPQTQARKRPLHRASGK